ncbi:PPOX class F420-dependent oxidoreductase [Ruania alkalisoli]|uniref:PPOX class F420-dependent oxidoreductase n=1 Tax=Ruania alkalisoli TaxID=2779775 RepID=A0A7M1SV71_9MICO|nr:PPOX class F420-dependent oxidoreductase [Ruania alkalisoli]QOR70977.1 PPOX class F420-dependent oxidoreductase [Ruania alkalisoli]
MPRRVRHRDDEYFALTTFRRDGTPVSTPIWLAPADGRLYGYTPSRSWKVRRIARDPRVEFAEATFHGVPTGAWRRGEARVMSGAELRVAKRAMTAKYGNRFRWFTIVTLLGRPRRRGGRAVGLEVTVDREGLSRAT